MTAEEKQRLLTYVSGMLFYYGVMPWQKLWQLAVKRTHIEITDADFRILLKETAEDLHSPYVFEFEDEICADYDVQDRERVQKKQSERTDLAYRPVSENEAACVVEDRFTSLWSEDEQAFYNWLKSRCGQDADLALTLTCEYANVLKNGATPLELAKKITTELELSGVEEVQSAAELIMHFAESTPLWELKGWRRSEV